MRDLPFRAFKGKYNFIESCCPKAINNITQGKRVRLERVPDKVIKIYLEIQNWNETNEVASQVGVKYVRVEITK